MRAMFFLLSIDVAFYMCKLVFKLDFVFNWNSLVFIKIFSL